MGNIFEFAANHPLLVSATIGMTLAVIFYELRRKAGAIAALGPAQAVRLINGGASRVWSIALRTKPANFIMLSEPAF